MIKKERKSTCRMRRKRAHLMFDLISCGLLIVAMSL